jgi:ribonucleoside-diphosphate reductase alpha chain
MDLDGRDSHSIQYQNANNSVRVTDEFMQAVVDGSDWSLREVTTGRVVRTLKARDLFRQLCEASWECADPGMQFDTTINRWHTAANTGRINGSNPCSEYMHLDDSACNLASINLLKFLNIDETFDVDGFRHAIEVLFTGQEILVGRADYPTEGIADTSRRFRQLGIGYANLGALLMALGLPYDSDGGRAYAAAVTSLMTGHAYEVSARTASRMGPFAGFAENREHMLRVLGQHQEAAARIDEELVPPDLLSAAQESWDMACELGDRYGVRNSQASVLAPTGTIGLMMDCDTTGIEPDLGLVKLKKLVGGGTMSIVNQTVPRALEQLGYGPGEIDDIIAYIDEHKSIVGAPHLLAEHLPVFACSMGDNVIHYAGHVKMMAAVQPFISGAISKTVNMPEEATVDEVEKLHIDAWRMGVKAIAIYRDNCKVGQPLSTAKKESASAPEPAATPADVATQVVEKIIKVPVREKMPRNRTSHTFQFRVADCKGFVTVGEYDDGRPGEIFLRVSKQGSTLAGIMDAFSISVSYGLQYGVPLRHFVEAFTNTRFEPAGITDDADLRIATSILDYIFRRLAVDYLSYEERAELGILTTGERTQPTLPGVEETVVETRQGQDVPADPPSIDSSSPTLFETSSAPREPSLLERAGVTDAEKPARGRTSPAIKPPAASSVDAPYCMQCGVQMQRAGSCHACPSCGSTSGCS